jgi:peroxidase
VSLLKGICPASGDDDATFFLDSATPVRFDNRYFANLIRGRGLLASDQELFSSPSAVNATASLVQLYSRSIPSFFASFPRSMIAMGNLNPLTGTSGQVRANCRVVNS